MFLNQLIAFEWSKLFFGFFFVFYGVIRNIGFKFVTNFICISVAVEIKIVFFGCLNIFVMVFIVYCLIIIYINFLSID